MGLSKEAKKRPVAKLAANGRSNSTHSNSNGVRVSNYEDSSLLDDKELLRILLQVRNG